MDKNLPIYVLATDILVACADIIPGEGRREPQGPSIDLEHANIVIPSVVIRELSSFEKEKSDRGRAAQTALRRLRELISAKTHPMCEVYNLNAETQQISILPVHKNFQRLLPFSPSDNDMGGQIILTTLAVMMHQKGLPIDGTAPIREVESLVTNNVVLLTNDNGLAIRAGERGIKTERYSYRYGYCSIVRWWHKFTEGEGDSPSASANDCRTPMQ